MLEARGLFKSYGDRAVVADLSLDVGAGEIVGLLGPNGAGKSTTVAMLCGLVAADRGEVFVGSGASRLTLDQDAHAAKRRIGVVPQELSIYENLGAAANLELFGALYGLAGALLRQRVGRGGIGSAHQDSLGRKWPQGTPPPSAANPPNGGAQPLNWGGGVGFARASGPSRLRPTRTQE